MSQTGKAYGVCLCYWASVVLFLPTLCWQAEARKQAVNSPLPVEQQVQLEKANRLAKSGKAAKATEKYEAALSTATNVEQCLAVAKATEKFGYPLMDVRRACLKKAITLGKSREDFFQIALAAREYQYYETTKAAIDFLIANAKTNEELFELAQKSEEIGLNDVAHLAMEKAYDQTRSVGDVLIFAKRAKLINLDDLMRKAVKELIDDEPSSQGLCDLLPELEPLNVSDLERYLLKKAVFAVKTVPDCKAVFEAAKRYGQPDIVNLAAYRGRKMLMLLRERAQAQEAGVQEQAALEAQEQRAANDLAKQNNNYNSGPGF